MPRLMYDLPADQLRPGSKVLLLVKDILLNIALMFIGIIDGDNYLFNICGSLDA